MTLLDRIARFRRSFRFKLLSIFVLATIMLATALVAVFIATQIHSFKSRQSDKAHLLANLLANGIRVPLYAGQTELLGQRAQEMLETPDVARIVISGSDGKVISETRSKNILSSYPVISATAPVHSSSSTPSVDSALTGVPEKASAQLGTVTVELDTGGLHAAIVRSLILASTLALGFCIVVVSLSYPILKRVTSSFQTLIDGLDTMMSGNFGLKINVESDDEVGRAARAVNRLAEALDERETENRNLQEELIRAMRLEMSEEKRKTMAKLIQTNRMTSLGLLVSSMAHNINTPNGAMKLAGENLSRCWKDAVPALEGVAKEEGDFVVGGLPFSIAKEEFHRAAESVVLNANRIDSVINDLRCYSVGASWEFNSNVSVNKAVEGGLSIIRAHGKHAAIPISPQLDHSVPDVNGNLYQLEQVVVNLLQNALMAMRPDGGRVTVCTRYDQESKEVQIVVKDEGEGISKEALRSLDEPFISTRIDRGGSGLGLYISNFLVKEHRGRISIETGEGVGTVVTVHLPPANQS